MVKMTKKIETIKNILINFESKFSMILKLRLNPSLKNLKQETEVHLLNVGRILTPRKHTGDRYHPC
jgi:hypothetical protein